MLPSTPCFSLSWKSLSRAKDDQWCPAYGEEEEAGKRRSRTAL